MKPSIAERLRRWGYALGSTSASVGLTPTSMLFLFYLTNVVGLRGSVAGLVLALPKIWDALVDPMLGGLTDRAATRLGRRVPFMLVSGLIFLAALFLMFSLPRLPAPWMMAALATLLLIISSTSQTVYGVCQLSMASDMTKDPTDLSKLLSFSNTVTLLIGIVASGLTPLLITWSGGGRIGYSLMAGEIALAAAIFLLAFATLTRSARVRTAQPQAAALSLIQSIRATGGNHAFYYLFAYFIVLGTGSAILTAFLPYANLYVLHGNQTGLAVLSVIVAATAIVGFALAPLMVARLGTARTLRLGNALLALSFGLVFAASYGPTWLTWIVLTVVGVFFGALLIVLYTTMLEVMNVKLKNGLVVPMGFYLGILLAGSKLGGSAGSFVAGGLLDAVGFVSGGGPQSAATIIGLRVGYSLIPMIIYGLAGLFLARVTVGSHSAADIPAATSEEAVT